MRAVTLSLAAYGCLSNRGANQLPLASTEFCVCRAKKKKLQRRSVHREERESKQKVWSIVICLLFVCCCDVMIVMRLETLRQGRRMLRTTGIPSPISAFFNVC